MDYGTRGPSLQGGMLRGPWKGVFRHHPALYLSEESFPEYPHARGERHSRRAATNFANSAADTAHCVGVAALSGIMANLTPPAEILDGSVAETSAAVQTLR